MAFRKCPICKEGKLVRTNTNVNRKQEYYTIYLQCDNCGREHPVCEFPQERARELLRYEKAYWKMREVVDKYY